MMATILRDTLFPHYLMRERVGRVSIFTVKVGLERPTVRRIRASSVILALRRWACRGVAIKQNCWDCLS
jgi:hypothetical protein